MLLATQVFFYGYDVIVVEQFTKSVQARTHKKKRINKKWLKRYGMKQVPRREIVVTNDRKIYMHPVMFEKLKIAIEKQNKEVSI